MGIVWGLAVGFSRGIRRDLGALKRWMLPSDPRGLQRGGIQYGGPPSAADGHDGRIHGDLIEVLAVGPPVRYPPADRRKHRFTWLGLHHGLAKPVRHLR